MDVNKDNVKAVLEYMNKTTADWYKSSVKDVNAMGARFSFAKFFTDKKLMDNAKVHLHDVFVECPFHADASPSLSYNEEKHIYQCFSCGSHGNIINLMTEYDVKILGYTTTYYQKINEILLEDPLMSSVLNIKSIYQENRISVEEGLSKFKPSFVTEKFRPSSFLEMSSQMLKQGCDKAQIKFFIILMCSGMPIQDVYREVFNLDDKSVGESSIDLMSILEEQEEVCQ